MLDYRLLKFVLFPSVVTRTVLCVTQNVSA